VRNLLDGTLTAEGNDALARYRAAWANLVALKSEAEALGGDRRALERELDMVRFQHREIADAGFEPGDETDLHQRATRLRHTEELRQRLGDAERAAGDQGGAEALETVAREIQAAARVDPSLEPLVEMSAQIIGLLSELSAEITRVASELDHEPRELEHVEGRLALLFDLKRKYGDDLQAVLEFEAIAEVRADELETLLQRSQEIDQLLAAALQGVQEAAGELTLRRQQAGEELAGAAIEHLQDLGFSDPVVAFTIAARDPGPEGADSITLEFASDRALPLAPVSKVASGGELSRLILALRLASGTADVSVIAFDEIDAGIGGATALAMGRKLKMLSRDRQVFCVTHLPQVAAFADRHFVIEREGNVATVTQLEGDRQLEELSRMLAGLPDSAQGRGHAAELLEIAARA
jgi:DNA repair protein RecN (Recombination protein N)